MKLSFHDVNHYSLPDNLPEPEDDGACDHLPGLAAPDIALFSTGDRWVNFSGVPEVRGRRVVLYCYPLTKKPGEELPAEWDAIPGARGCTPQSCAFRDSYSKLQRLNAEVYGLSTQSTAYQKELAGRLHLPFELLSDAELKWVRSIGLPTFTADGMSLVKRLTLIIEQGVIVKVFYPVFPPHKNAEDVLDWLSEN